MYAPSNVQKGIKNMLKVGDTSESKKAYIATPEELDLQTRIKDMEAQDERNLKDLYDNLKRIRSVLRNKHPERKLSAKDSS